MSIITTGSIKGGVGKTTLAVNMAVHLARTKASVLLIDGDEQGTAIAFSEIRGANQAVPQFTAVALYGGAIRTQVKQLSPRFDHIIIDVGGRDSGSLRAALIVSDLVLIPTAPRSFDLWGVEQTVELVREAREINARLRAVAVLNGADPSGKDNHDALALLNEIDGLEVSPHRLGRRKAYPNAAALGLSVEESGNNPDAISELQALMAWLFPSQGRNKKL
jgi:chromosome partitioning protein